MARNTQARDVPTQSRHNSAGMKMLPRALSLELIEFLLVFFSFIGDVRKGFLMQGDGQCRIMEVTPETGSVSVRSLPVGFVPVYTEDMDIRAVLFRLARIQGLTVDIDEETDEDVRHFLRYGEGGGEPGPVRGSPGGFHPKTGTTEGPNDVGVARKN